MQTEDEEGEIDLNMQEYKERRLAARRSPYPSIVIEVRSTPRPDFSAPLPPPPSGPESPERLDDDDDGDYIADRKITPDFIQQLETLFTKSAYVKDEKKKDEFYGSIGSHIEEISAASPMMQAEMWISENDPLFDIDEAAFTLSETKHIDEAYEFVFVNMAMQTSQFLSDSTVNAGAQRRQYLVMPNFLTASATSFEKFAKEVNNIIDALPQLRGKMNLSCLHPEHVQEDKRSSVPVFTLEWLG